MPASSSSSAGAVTATTVPFSVILRAVMEGGTKERPLLLTFAPPVKMPWDGVDFGAKPSLPKNLGSLARGGVARMGAAGAGMAEAMGNAAASKMWSERKASGVERRIDNLEAKVGGWLGSVLLRLPVASCCSWRLLLVGRRSIHT